LKTIAIFAHNPGITEFVNDLTDSHLDDMPTCGVFAVKANVTHWKLFAASEKEFLFLIIPEMSSKEQSVEVSDTTGDAIKYKYLR